VNDVAGEGVGIDADINAATFLTPTTAVEMPAMPKRELADRILDEILALRRPRQVVVEIDGSPAIAGDRQSDRERLPDEAASPRRQRMME
jgi:hypothetical protein